MSTPARRRRRASAVLAPLVLTGGAWAAGSAPVAMASSSSTTPVPTTAAPTGAPFLETDGRFRVAFAAAPRVVATEDASSTSYLVNVDEDSQTVTRFAAGALGPAPGAPVGDHVAAFLGAAGSDVERLAETSTRFGPSPAALFVSSVTLVSGARAALYGVVVVDTRDTTYAVATDVGSDDGDAARAFVESFTVLFDPLPSPAPAAPSPTPSATAAATTTLPAGAIESHDRRWWVRFPDDADVTLEASSEDGFAYAEYAANGDDGGARVRTVELPLELDLDAAAAVADEADRSGLEVIGSVASTVGPYPAVRATLAGDGGAADVLVVRAGRQLHVVVGSSEDRRPSDDAVAFVDSFVLR